MPHTIRFACTDKSIQTERIVFRFLSDRSYISRVLCKLITYTLRKKLCRKAFPANQNVYGALYPSACSVLENCANLLYTRSGKTAGRTAQVGLSGKLERVWGVLLCVHTRSGLPERPACTVSLQNFTGVRKLRRQCHTCLTVITFDFIP